MSFSLLTNVASLSAQANLAATSGFQSQTISKVSSGLRITNSGVDAAGLSIANGFRSQESVLHQGIANANDGIGQLQTADGGLNNISSLLDRARTLATQSASGTFTGDRGALNSEFQSVIKEVDRQAQSIGLNVGGTFAKSLSVFIGGGAGTSAAAIATNSTETLDLSKSTVDSQSLGLRGYAAGYSVNTSTGAQDTGLYDLGAASAKTSVAAILADATNAGVLTGASGNTGFTLKFGAQSAVITVNTSGVSSTSTLASAINSAIATASVGNSASAAGLQKANVVAEIHTGADGAQQLQFTSATQSFQVAGNDVVSNAFLGNFDSTTGGQVAGSGSNASTVATGSAVAGLETSSFLSSGTQQTASQVFVALAGGDAQTLTFTTNNSTGTAQSVAVNLTAANGATIGAAVTAINTALQASNQNGLTNIFASTDAAGTKIIFSSASTNTFAVTTGLNAVAGTPGDGLGGQNAIAISAQAGQSSTADISNLASATSAVAALGNATAALGLAQAAVGRGENQFTYATNLAQSQLTNLASSESSLRDADLATESANLTKAQILLQAGVAALAQANSAPQSLLKLLQ